MKNIKLLIKLFILITIILFSFLVIYYFLNNNFKDLFKYNNEEVIQSYPTSYAPLTQDSNIDFSTLIWEEISLNNITTVKPSNWDIEELVLDSPIINDDNYTISTFNLDPNNPGFVGFVIVNDENFPVFIMGSQDGVGIMGVDSTFYKFEDTDMNFIKDSFINGKNYYQRTDWPDKPTIIEIKEPYTEFSLFGRRFRRIDKHLFLDNDSDIEYFNTANGGNEEFTTFKNVFYKLDIDLNKDNQNDQMNLYYYKLISKNIRNQTDLLILDKIFNSTRSLMQKNN